VFAKVNVSQGASGVFNYSDVVDCPHDIRKDKKVQPFKKSTGKDLITASKPSISTFAPVKKLNQALMNVSSFLQSVLKNSENMSSKEFLIDEFEWKIKDTKGEIEMKRLNSVMKPAQATTENVQIDIQALSFTKKLKKIQKREDFADLAKTAGEAQAYDKNRNRCFFTRT